MKRILRAMLLLLSALYLGFLFVALFLSDSMIFLPHLSSYKDSAEILKITTAGGKKSPPSICLIPRPNSPCW